MFTCGAVAGVDEGAAGDPRSPHCPATPAAPRPSAPGLALLGDVRTTPSAPTGQARQARPLSRGLGVRRGAPTLAGLGLWLGHTDSQPARCPAAGPTSPRPRCSKCVRGPADRQCPSPSVLLAAPASPPPRPRPPASQAVDRGTPFALPASVVYHIASGVFITKISKKKGLLAI